VRVAQAVEGDAVDSGGPEGRLEDARPERAGVEVRVAILHRLPLGRPVVTGF
jgi:hypothetical protein